MVLSFSIRVRLLLAGALTCSSVAVAGCGSEPVVRDGTVGAAVKDGADGSGLKKTVFFLSELGGMANTRGSSTNVRYKRCLLTASHVKASPPLGFAYMGPDLSGLDSDKTYKKELVVKRWDHPGGATPWTDLAVVWLTDVRGEESIALGDYAPWKIKDSIGLGNKNLSQELSQISGVSSLGSPSAGAPKSANVAGFGFNDTVNGTDVGGLILRIGSMQATHFFQGPNQTIIPKRDGGFYVLQPPANANKKQSACRMDSGGPAYQGSKVFGVIHGYMTSDNSSHCNKSNATIAVSLDKAKRPGKRSNFEWVDRKIEEVCAKKMRATPQGSGRVDGTISPGQLYTDQDNLNEIIDCEDGVLWDCEELAHEQQTVTLVATAASGWTFERWEHGTEGDCECHDDTSSTCVIGYPDMGYYDVAFSHDTEHCVAVFSQDIPSGSSGAGGFGGGSSGGGFGGGSGGEGGQGAEASGL